MAILPSSADVVPSSCGQPNWRRELADAVRDLDELCRLLDLSPSQLGVSRGAMERFPLLAPRGYVARMERGNPRDALLLQVLPRREEEQARPGFVPDPVADEASQLAPGILQKYHQRVLIVTTGACAVHCRYCFRRNFAYDDLPDFPRLWESAARQVAADRSIREVILSGGDPLTIADQRLSRLASRLAQIGHLRRLRVHTRLPILIPSRVNDELLAWLAGTRLTPVAVIHANHPAELDEAVARAIGRLVDAGIVVLNQAVLLRGINDDAQVLASLCERLIDLRVLPYYLHQLDRVAGAAHFEVPRAVGRRLMARLRHILPGYAVPRYVRETPGQPSKTPLA
jgi:EF-P beta-lysylation protein EpmB